MSILLDIIQSFLMMDTVTTTVSLCMYCKVLLLCLIVFLPYSLTYVYTITFVRYGK